MKHLRYLILKRKVVKYVSKIKFDIEANYDLQKEIMHYRHINKITSWQEYKLLVIIENMRKFICGHSVVKLMNE